MSMMRTEVKRLKYLYNGKVVGHLVENKSGKIMFQYDENIKSYTLSLAYDITKLPNKFEHEMTVNSNGNPTEDDLLAVCDIMNLQKDICKKIISHIKDVIRKYK